MQLSASLLSVVLYGVGSPIIVDVEQTCMRLGIPILATIKNIDGDDFSTRSDDTIYIDSVDAELFTHPIAVPLFTPGHRQNALKELKSRGANDFACLIDPTAIVPSSFEAGTGSYVNCGVTAGGVCRLGRHVFVNRSASLGHHFIADDYVSIGPGVTVAGHVTVGRGAVIGAGAVVLPGLFIGENAVVSAGSVVVEDVPANTLVMGHPAKVTKSGIAGYNGVSVS